MVESSRLNGTLEKTTGIYITKLIMSHLYSSFMDSSLASSSSVVRFTNEGPLSTTVRFDNLKCKRK